MTRVPASRVAPTCISDVGQPGHGPQVIPPLTPGLLGDFGYTSKGSETQRHRALNSAVRELGKDAVSRHLRAIVTLQRWNPPTHDIMLDDFNYLREKYYPHRIGVYTPVGY